MRLNISNQEKEKDFKYPESVDISFGRRISTAVMGGCVYSVNYCEKQGRSSVIVVKTGDGQRQERIIYTDGYCHQPSAASPGDRIAVVWNEFSQGRWYLRYVELDEGLENVCEVQDAGSSEQMFLPADVCGFGGDVYIVWPRTVDKSLRIFLMRKTQAGFEEIGFISDRAAYANRPVITAESNKMLIAWDEYAGGKFETVFTEFAASGGFDVQRISHEKGNCFCPQVSGSGGKFLLTYIITKDVEDGLGIVDHDTGVGAAVVQDNEWAHLLDEANKDDGRMAAYLRDGLLPSEIYKGYLGLRRNHVPVICDDGIYVLREVRPEKDFTSLEGKLIAKKYLGDNKWGSEVIVEQGFYGYSIAKGSQDGSIGLSYFDYVGQDTGIIKNRICSIADGHEVYEAGDDWQRWGPTVLERSDKKVRAVKHKNDEYQIFWADTHCHSGFSGDAEGEVDELIHFARDKAGLDAICVIDNDYYPHKSLSQAEWQVHKGYSRVFSEDGVFLVFAGFEFTFHDSSIRPDFNHRIIMYPDASGKLCRRIDAETNSMDKLYGALRGEKVVIYPHHCSYKLYGDAECGVEVCSSWRVCLEETDFTVQQLKNGAKIGFIGSSDTHRLVPGLGGAATGIYAKELTAEAVYEAYINRRTLASQGFHVSCDFKVNECFIGEQGKTDADPQIYCNVSTTDEVIELVNVVRDGEVVYECRPGSTDCEFEFADEGLAAGEHFYYVRIKVAGESSFNFEPGKNSLKPFTKESKYPHNLSKAVGVFAWTSPIWIEKQ